jgi:hypothetical protein
MDIIYNVITAMRHGARATVPAVLDRRPLARQTPLLGVAIKDEDSCRR